MRHKIEKGIFFLILSFLSLVISFNPSLTGAVIGIIIETSYLYILSLVFFLVSIFFFLSRQTLDVIVIPTGTWEADIDRAKKALSERDRLKGGRYFVISGYKGQGTREMREGQSYRIYKYLRSQGVIPGDIRIEGKSHDSEENVLYTLKKLKDMEEKMGRSKPLEIAFVSSPSHLKRFHDFYNAAVQKGLVDRGDFRFHEIPTEGLGEEAGYEASPFRRLIHEYKLRTMNRYKKKSGGVKHVEKPDPVLDFLRKLDRLRKRGK